MTVLEPFPIPRAMEVPAELTAFAQELADIARAQTLPRWAEQCAAMSKSDSAFDPVTEADRAAERIMRHTIRARFPDHGVSGEEWPDEAGTSPWSWSLDPIDGTRSFICRLPNWTTLIALLHDGEPALGLIDAPCLDEMYLGHGDQTWLVQGGRTNPIRTSGCRTLAGARFSTTDPFLFEGVAFDAFDRLRQRIKTTRYGQDGYAYARLAAGSLDLVVECGLKPHDYQALIPVIRGAGGTVGDWKGGEDFAQGRIIAAATTELYEDAVALLAPCA